jgi:hypothetical protein
LRLNNLIQERDLRNKIIIAAQTVLSKHERSEQKLEYLQCLLKFVCVKDPSATESVKIDKNISESKYCASKSGDLFEDGK